MKSEAQDTVFTIALSNSSILPEADASTSVVSSPSATLLLSNVGVPWLFDLAQRASSITFELNKTWTAEQASERQVAHPPFRSSITNLGLGQNTLERNLGYLAF